MKLVAAMAFAFFALTVTSIGPARAEHAVCGLEEVPNGVDFPCPPPVAYNEDGEVVGNDAAR